MPPQKSVLITGCSAGGIGSALVSSFQKRGLLVFATARTASKMAHLEELPNVHLLTLDVTSPSSIASAVESVKTKNGGTLDYLVNNSGVAHVMPILDTDLAVAKSLFDVNLWAVMAMTQAFAPMLIQAKGKVVNVGSINGVLTVPYMGVYNASKAALHALSETLRVEMAPLGVKVVTVVTGVVRTNIMNNNQEAHLPSGSAYASVEKNVSARSRGEDIKGAVMPSEKFAEKVVSDVLGGANGVIWRGQLASAVRLLTNLLPTFIQDRVMVADTGLDTFGKVS